MTNNIILGEAIKKNPKPTFSTEIVLTDKHIASIETVNLLTDTVKKINEETAAIVDYYSNLVFDVSQHEICKLDRSEIKKKAEALKRLRIDYGKVWAKPLDKFSKTANEAEKALMGVFDDLGNKIAELEGDTIKEKTLFATTILSNITGDDEDLAFLTIEQLKPAINFKTKETAIEKELKEKVESVKNDLKLIETQANKVQILAQYHNTLDASSAIIEINERIEAEEKVIAENKRLAEEKLAQEEAKKAEIIAQAELPIAGEQVIEVQQAIANPIHDPVADNDKKLDIQVLLQGITRNQYMLLKNFCASISVDMTIVS